MCCLSLFLLIDTGTLKNGNKDVIGELDNPDPLEQWQSYSSRWLSIAWLPLPIDTVHVSNGADRYLLCSDPVFHHPHWLEINRNSRVLRYFTVNKWLLLCCVWLWEEVCLTDRAKQLHVPMALREAEHKEEEVCLQRWEVNILNTSIRAMPNGKNISRLERQWIFFFFRRSVWPGGWKHNTCVKTCLLRHWGTLLFCIHVQVCPSSQTNVFFRLKETKVKGCKLAMNWLDFFFLFFKRGFSSCHRHSILSSTVVHRRCVCPNGRGRHCGFIWSYKPSGWAELC